MSTATYSPGTSINLEAPTWWRRILVPIGVGLAVVTPLAMWWRRLRKNGD